MEGRRWTSCPVSESGELVGRQAPPPSSGLPLVVAAFFYFIICFALLSRFFFSFISCCYWMAAPEGGPAAPSAVIWLRFNNARTEVRCGPQLSHLHTHTHKDGIFYGRRRPVKGATSLFFPTWNDSVTSGAFTGSNHTKPLQLVSFFPSITSIFFLHTLFSRLSKVWDGFLATRIWRKRTLEFSGKKRVKTGSIKLKKSGWLGKLQTSMEPYPACQWELLCLRTPIAYVN